MSVTVLDVGQAAGILAGGVLALTHGLLQRRVAGLVLGVNGHIVVPCRTVHGGHGQGHEDGIAGEGHVFRDAGFHHQVQALLHVGCKGVTGSVRLGHGRAILDRSFQRVLDGGGIGGQGSGQLIVEHIAGEVVDAALGLVCFCAGQADGRQDGGAAVTVVETIQHTHLTLTVHQFIVHGDVSDAEVGKLHALNGVLAQLVDNRVVMQAGGNVGLSIPRAIVAGLGDVVLVDGKGCFLAGVDGRRRICCGKCCGHQPKGHKRRQQQCQHAMDLFHLAVSFIKSDFLQK